jgi:hypothetical protein
MGGIFSAPKAPAPPPGPSQAELMLSLDERKRS